MIDLPAAQYSEYYKEKSMPQEDTEIVLQKAAARLAQYLENKQNSEPPAKRANNEKSGLYTPLEFDNPPHTFYKNTQGYHKKPPLAVEVLGNNETESDASDEDII